jgi:hypothetical protein
LTGGVAGGRLIKLALLGWTTDTEKVGCVDVVFEHAVTDGRTGGVRTGHARTFGITGRRWDVLVGSNAMKTLVVAFCV